MNQLNEKIDQCKDIIYFFVLVVNFFFFKKKMKPCTLSREEEVELARSNKKVKDYHHVEFNDGSKESSPAPGQQSSGSFAKASFKEKLVGEMPGAYVSAFDFESLMEEDELFNGEGSETNGQILEGWVTVKLTMKPNSALEVHCQKLL